jgi:archaellum component FlaF (FlaF/FlaG flagellin family)
MEGLNVQCRVSRGLRRLLRCRRGTAEIIGSVMFLLIMLFFFTNVFLWHDNATREMDDALAEKMNSLVSIQVVNENITKTGGALQLKITNNGGVGVELSRLWIIEYLGGGHEIHNFRDRTDWIGAGKTITIPLAESDIVLRKENAFTIVTTRGNMAACSCVPVR